MTAAIHPMQGAAFGCRQGEYLQHVVIYKDANQLLVDCLHNDAAAATMSLELGVSANSDWMASKDLS